MSDQVSFGPAKSYAAGMFPTGVTSADFEGDGNLDLGRSKRCGRAGRFAKRLPRYRDASKNARNLCAYSGCSYAST